jgi:hypothetical protein
MGLRENVPVAASSRMIVAVSDAVTVTLAVVGAVIALGLLAVLRLVLRREPAGARWRRYRLGVFLERNGISKGDDDPPAQ